VANSIARDPGLNAHLTLTTAIVMGGAVIVATLALAIRALSGFSLRGDAV